jgi:hypothetical protein
MPGDGTAARLMHNHVNVLPTTVVAAQTANQSPEHKIRPEPRASAPELSTHVCWHSRQIARMRDRHLERDRSADMDSNVDFAVSANDGDVSSAWAIAFVAVLLLGLLSAFA